ncbi:MAG: hypothetical protein ACFFCD_09800 [Promethearchaeota archaeon]
MERKSKKIPDSVLERGRSLGFSDEEIENYYFTGIDVRTKMTEEPEKRMETLWKGMSKAVPEITQIIERGFNSLIEGKSIRTIRALCEGISFAGHMVNEFKENGSFINAFFIYTYYLLEKYSNRQYGQEYVV